MWNSVRGIVTSAFRDLRSSWRDLALTDIAYKVIAFAVLSPVTFAFLYWLRSRASFQVMADVDILRYFVTTRMGVVALLLGGSLIFAITALEAACLMAIGFAAANGVRIGTTRALTFAATRAPNVLRLVGNMVARLFLGALPFLVSLGLVYWKLLHEHDINFYLSQRPPVFWLAGALVGLLGLAMAALLIWTIARWAFALPLVLFEGVSPRVALGESARRSVGSRWLVVVILAGWAVVASALATTATWLPEAIGRVVAPHLGASVAPLLLFITALALVWGALALAAAIVNVSLWSLLLTRIYLHVGEPREPLRPIRALTDPQAGQPFRFSGRTLAGVAGVAVLAAVGVAVLTFLVARVNRPVLVIAHRGASAAAPENTLAAFRLAGEQRADFVELDVQETADGEIVVVHDSDLMKLAGDSRKIWNANAAELRAIDIGSRFGTQFSTERMPTLAEALAACKGKTRVIVELKSYGHNQRLEERVAAVVEAAGMENDCIFMSLDHGMMRKLKKLRPAWRCGILVAKARGDLTSLGADFLAVESRMATPRFVRKAHRAGQDVYVWTVNDPAWMLLTMSRGVDGLITDKPDLALTAVARRARMSDAQRVLVALLVRAGARTESLEAEDALRP